MRTTRDVEHDQAVQRRLEMLTAELKAVRTGEPDTHLGDEPATSHSLGSQASAQNLVGSYESVAPDTHTRIRPDRVVLMPADSGPPTQVRGEEKSVAWVEDERCVTTSTVLPDIGRHARRFQEAPGALVRGVRGVLGARRLAIGPGQLAVLALVLVVAMAGLCVWLVQRQPDEVAAQVPAESPISQVAPLDAGAEDGSINGGVAADVGAASAAKTGANVGNGAEAGASAGEVIVHVAGKVKHPGIEVLPAGSRVVDAVKAAGGARPGVDLDSLNLARPLVDGEQILVGTPAPVGAAGQMIAGDPAGSTSSTTSTGALVNLNTAGQTELESLPEVGPVTATAIMAWRDEHGGFTSVDELLEVDGIGDATLAQIAPHVTL